MKGCLRGGLAIDEGGGSRAFLCRSPVSGIRPSYEQSHGATRKAPRHQCRPTSFVIVGKRGDPIMWLQVDSRLNMAIIKLALFEFTLICSFHASFKDRKLLV